MRRIAAHIDGDRPAAPVTPQSGGRFPPQPGMAAGDACSIVIAAAEPGPVAGRFR